MNRIRIWLSVYQGRRAGLFIILYSLIGAYDLIGSQLFNGKLPTIVDLLPDWSWRSWLIVGIVILWLIALENIYQTAKENANTNWIENYKTREGHLPPIPNYLLPVINGYKQGDPISRNIQVINASAQFWNRLLPSQQDELVQLLEWLGKDPGDYLQQVKQMSPPAGRHPGLKWRK